MRLEYKEKNSFIEAEKISIGEDFQIGENVHIKVRKEFNIGNYSRFGDNVEIVGESVSIGDHFFHLTPGLRVGGGGSQFPKAVLRVGDRCVFHNNYINVCQPVLIGNDVGLSPDVDIITHGFWNSILEGYPVKYEEVVIGNGVIIGQRSFVNVGAQISDYVVIGANSTVVGKLLVPKSVYAGCPAKFIRNIVEPSAEKKERIFNIIMEQYLKLAGDVAIRTEYPFIYINNAKVDVEHCEIEGEEDNVTDALRDFLRRYGIRIYTKRPFKSLIYKGL